MIWLRAQIERGRKHPWLGPLFIILLLLLLVFVALHATMDQSHGADDSELVCVVLGIFVLLVSLVPRPPEIEVRRVASSRGPPRPVRRATVARPSTPAFVPLRL